MNCRREEMQDGVRVIRAPVLFRVSKGVIMPTFGLLADRLVLENDVIQLHLPQFDAAGVALRGRMLKKPTVITYHCDLLMPPGLLSWLANQAVKVMNNLAAVTTHRIVTYTRDYAENSSFLNRYLNKLQVIPPPVELPEIPPEAISAFASENNPQNHRPVIGMAARFANEKGVEVLLDAMPHLLEAYPNALVEFAGPYKISWVKKPISRGFIRASRNMKRMVIGNSWVSSTLSQMAAFYPNIDVLVLPSLNSTEAFGLVQIKSMLNGVPTVASNLPGVRQPVLRHGMGKIIPIGDSDALATALIEILGNPTAFQREVAPIKECYQPDTIAIAYEKLFHRDSGRAASHSKKFGNGLACS